jgi:hypothetical protein
MAYNLTGIDNAVSIVEIMKSTNEMLNGWLIGLLLVTFFVILFIMFKHQDTVVAFISTFFILSILTILLWAAEFVSMTFVFIPIILLIVSIFYYIFARD